MIAIALRASYDVQLAMRGGDHYTEDHLDQEDGRKAARMLNETHGSELL